VISQLAGRLALKDLDRVEVMTPGGVGYEVFIPLSAYEVLPKQGEDALLYTHLVVKEDGWQLYGFASAYERRVFQRVLAAKGVGPALALGMLSTLGVERLVRSIRDKDVTVLQSVPRVGRKKAEQIILDLADKIGDVGAADASGPGVAPKPEGAAADDAIRALVSLGYSTADGERAVRAAIDSGAKGMAASDLIRAALAKIGAR
jgi:Holliday junction DNA helicase RuvA